MSFESVSVIIPCYNRADTILRSVESVLSQSYPITELLVVDDGSTDSTPELLQNYPDSRLHYLRYEQNRGACYARNYGFDHSHGDFIAINDSDDQWAPDKIEKELSFLLSAQADMVFCGMDRVSVKGEHYYFPVHGFRSERDPLEQQLAENRVGTQTIFLRRKVWDTVRFDDSIKRFQDWDFALRVMERFSVAYLPESLACSAVRGDSISVSVKSADALRVLYNKHHHLYERYPKAHIKMLRRMGKHFRNHDPDFARTCYIRSFKLSHHPYDLWMRISCRPH